MANVAVAVYRLGRYNKQIRVGSTLSRVGSHSSKAGPNQSEELSPRATQATLTLTIVHSRITREYSVTVIFSLFLFSECICLYLCVCVCVYL